MTRLVRTVAFTVTLMAAAAAAAHAQRGGRAGGGLPRLTTAQPAPARPAPAMPSRGGIMTVPRAVPGRPGAQPGDLPRMYDGVRGRSRFGGIGFGQPGFSNRGSRFGHVPFTRRRLGGCVFGCSSFGGFGLKGRFSSGFFLGYPFAFPVYVPYPYDVGYADDTRYAEYGEAPYSEPGRAASKLIVVGAGRGGGGDALTVETIADSVRLTWLGATGRPVREVRLFVSDSAQRPLATRSASPAQPSATFEVATLSAPVAFAGVTVVFADSVTSTTVVPYRNAGPGGQRR